MMRLSAFVAVAGIAGSVLADGPTLTGSSAVAAGFSGRSVLINQADGAANGRASQNFGDFPDFTCGAFDDITFGSAVNLTSMTIYGQNSLAGGEAANVSVNYQIRTAPDLVGGTIVASGLGTQLGGVLTFDLTGVSLTAGTYWEIGRASWRERV